MKLRSTIALLGIALAASTVSADDRTVKMLTSTNDPYLIMGYLPYFCEKQNVKIELTQVQGLPVATSAQSVITGAHDIASTVNETAIIADKNGATLTINANVSAGGNALIVRPEIKSLADLKGKKIAAPNGTEGEKFLRGLLSTVGLTVGKENADVTLIDVPHPAMPAALGSGQVAGFYGTYPSIATVVESGQGHALAKFESLRPLVSLRSFYDRPVAAGFTKCYAELHSALANPADKVKQAELAKAGERAKELGFVVKQAPNDPLAYKHTPVFKDANVVIDANFAKSTGKLPQDFIVPSWYNQSKRFAE